MPTIKPEHFVNTDGFVVLHATGEVVGVAGEGGEIGPVPPPPSGLPGVTVVNPPGFAGFPEHDRDDPAFKPETHGLDPAELFTHFESDHPLFVENATGKPRYRVVDGKLEDL